MDGDPPEADDRIFLTDGLSSSFADTSSRCPGGQGSSRTASFFQGGIGSGSLRPAPFHPESDELQPLHDSPCHWLFHPSLAILGTPRIPTWILPRQSLPLQQLRLFRGIRLFSRLPVKGFTSITRRATPTSTCLSPRIRNVCFRSIRSTSRESRSVIRNQTF